MRPVLGLAALVATLALLPAGTAAAAGCGARRSTTVATDRALRIFFLRTGTGTQLVRRYYACDRLSGRRRAVGRTRPRDDTGLFSNADHWTLAGRWFAHRIVFDGGADQVENIDRQRFGTRQQVLDDISEDTDGATMSRLVIANDGSAAWSLKVASSSATFKGSLVAAATPNGDPVQLACGRSVRAGSLTLAAGSLSWIEAGATRSIAFPGAIPSTPPESACSRPIASSASP